MPLARAWERRSLAGLVSLLGARAPELFLESWGRSGEDAEKLGIVVPGALFRPLAEFPFTTFYDERARDRLMIYPKTVLVWS